MNDRNVTNAMAVFFLVLAVIAILLNAPRPLPSALRYRCIVTVQDEVLCFEPNGAMFRPERRFDKFILEVPK